MRKISPFQNQIFINFSGVWWWMHGSDLFILSSCEAIIVEWKFIFGISFFIKYAINIVYGIHGDFFSYGQYYQEKDFLLGVNWMNCWKSQNRLPYTILKILLLHIFHYVVLYTFEKVKTRTIIIVLKGFTNSVCEASSNDMNGFNNLKIYGSTWAQLIFWILKNHKKINSLLWIWYL